MACYQLFPVFCLLYFLETSIQFINEIHAKFIRGNKDEKRIGKRVTS